MLYIFIFSGCVYLDNIRFIHILMFHDMKSLTIWLHMQL